jgi:hypothetical protein
MLAREAFYATPTALFALVFSDAFAPWPQTMILLPPPPKCWDYRQEPVYLTQSEKFYRS